MLLARRISFILFSLTTLFLLGTGLLYSLAPRIMSYHQAVIGLDWAEMSTGTQIMTRSFMRAAGAGFLTASLALIFLLVFPFRAGEGWAAWAILIITLSQYLLVLKQVVGIVLNTEAQPPMAPFIIMPILAVIAFILALAGNRGAVVN